MSLTPIKKAIVQTTFADANNYMKDGVLLRKVINYIDDIDFSEYKERHAFAEIYETILKELQSAGSAGEFYTPRAVTDFMAQMINPQIGEKMADFACGTGGFITSWLKALHKKVKTTEDEALYANSIYGIEKKQFPYILCITNMLLHDLDVPQVFHDNTLLRDVMDYTEDDQVDVILMIILTPILMSILSSENAQRFNQSKTYFTLDLLIGWHSTLLRVSRP